MIKVNLNVKELYNSDFNFLAKEAEYICLKNYGKKVFLRALLEFSNECKMNCLYCGLRKDNRNIKRYFLSVQEIKKIIKKNYLSGFRTFVLQSGEFVNFKFNELCDIIYKLKKEFKNITITLSCGYFTKRKLKLLKESGVDRYLIRFEVADEKIYSYLKNGLSLKKRIEMLYNLKELNFETGSGFMIGLPGENDEILIKNLELCYKLNLDMIGIGPFIPHPDTPLNYLNKPSFEKVLKITAILRILLPYSNIPATTASGTLEPYGREKLLKVGANVLMPNITPPRYKKYYLLYPGKICINENADTCILCLKQKLKKINRELSFDTGSSINFTMKNNNLELNYGIN